MLGKCLVLVLVFLLLIMISQNIKGGYKEEKVIGMGPPKALPPVHLPVRLPILPPALPPAPAPAPRGGVSYEQGGWP